MTKPSYDELEEKLNKAHVKLATIEKNHEDERKEAEDKAKKRAEKAYKRNTTTANTKVST